MSTFPITDADIDVRNLGEWMLHTILADYVKQGLGVTSNTSTNEITVDAGVASIADDGRLFSSELESATTEPFATTTGTNYVYLSFDESDGVTEIEVVDTEGAVTGPALLIGEVDGATGDVTLQNQHPEIPSEWVVSG